VDLAAANAHRVDHGHSGSGNFSFVVKGRSAHAGRNPEDGRNAVVAASELALRLAMSKTPGLSVNPAKIDGGGPSNVVPDLAILRVNMRPRTTDDQEIAGRLIAKAVDETAKQHEVYIEVHGGFGRPPKPLTEEAEAVHHASSCHVPPIRGATSSR
jgi:glutamate carboxypeptidase